MARAWSSIIGLEREEASAAMEFEKAAALHAQWHKVKAAQALADELVQPLPRLRAVIVQKAAREDGVPAAEAEPAAAVFLLEAGCLAGPARLSVLGVRAVKEQTSVGSSLFAQPLMLQAVPLEAGDVTAMKSTPAESPEVRAAGVLALLDEQMSASTDMGTLSDHLSLLRRWYYRPEKQRAGEVFFANADGSWPLRRILRGAARMALGEPAPMAETQRDLATHNSGRRRASGRQRAGDWPRGPLIHFLQRTRALRAAKTSDRTGILHSGFGLRASRG